MDSVAVVPATGNVVIWNVNVADIALVGLAWVIVVAIIIAVRRSKING
jgi:hypothetical protein